MTRSGFAAAGVALLLILPPPVLAQERPADRLPSIEELARSFEPDGDPAAGRDGIRLHAAAETPSGATPWIQLLAVVERVDRALAPTAVRAVGLGREGEGEAGAALLLEAASGAATGDRSSLLHLAALLAEADDPQGAAEIRSRIVAEHPGTFEAPEATLREARRLLAIDARRSEGLDLLEGLLVRAPDHPVAPEARRLFERERSRTIPQEAPR